MKRLLASLVLTLFTLTTVSAQNYALPDNLQPITAENAAQLTPLAQLGGAAPIAVAWSPSGQTLLASTSDGMYRYQLDDLDNGDFFAGITDLRYSTGETYAVSGVDLLDGDSFEVINGDGNQRFSSDGSVLITYEMVGDSPMMHFADAETLVEFGALSGSGNVLVSEDRRRAAVWNGGDYLQDEFNYTYQTPYHMELWDIETNTLLAEDDYQLDTFFPPQFAGKWLIVGYYSDYIGGSVQVWDTETGAIVLDVPAAGTNTIPTISPNGSWLVSSRYTNAELITLNENFASTQFYHRDETERGDFSRAIFSPDSRYIVGDTSEGLMLWDVNALVETPIALLTDETLIAFGNQENVLLTRDDEGTLSLWDVDATDATLRFEIERVQGNDGMPSFSPDDSLLLTSDGRLIDTTTRDVRYTFPSSAVPRFNSDWSKAAYWLIGTLMLVDVKTGSESALMSIENDLGRLLEINPISELALFHANDQMMRGYELRTGELRFELSGIVNARFNANGTHIVATADDNTSTTIWNVEGDEAVSLLTIDAPLRSSTISADGQLFAFITTPEPPTNDNAIVSYTVELWDVESAEKIGQRMIESRTIPRLNFSHDHQLLNILIFDMALFCPTVANDAECALIHFPVDSYMHPDRTIFSSDGATVVLQLYMTGPDGANGRFLYVQSLETILTEEININGYNDVINHIATAQLSADSSLLLTGDGYPAQVNPPRHLRLLDITGEELFVFDGLHAGAFSPDNSLVATGSARIQLWDVDALRTGEAEPVAILATSIGGGLTFNADGTLLFVYEQRRVTLWGVSPREQRASYCLETSVP